MRKLLLNVFFLFSFAIVAISCNDKKEEKVIEPETQEELNHVDDTINVITPVVDSLSVPTVENVVTDADQSNTNEPAKE